MDLDTGTLLGEGIAGAWIVLANRTLSKRYMQVMVIQTALRSVGYLLFLRAVFGLAFHFLSQ